MTFLRVQCRRITAGQRTKTHFLEQTLHRCTQKTSGRAARQIAGARYSAEDAKRRFAGGPHREAEIEECITQMILEGALSPRRPAGREFPLSRCSMVNALYGLQG